MLNTAPNTLVTTYLHMISPDQFNPSFISNSNMQILPMGVADIHFYRYLYRSVGEDLRWRDRLVMPDSELEAVLRSPNTRVYVLYIAGAPAGYVELAKHNDGSVEIAYFGLRAQYHGRGLGKHLLSFGIQRAWDLGARRVWVHTCNLDGTHAMDNYRKRGFQVYQQLEEPMPERYM